MEKVTFLSLRALGVLMMAVALVGSAVVFNGPQPAAAQTPLCLDVEEVGQFDTNGDNVISQDELLAAGATEADAELAADFILNINCDNPISINQGGGDDGIGDVGSVIDIDQGNGSGGDDDGGSVIDIDQGNCPDNGEGGQDVEVGGGTPVIDIDQRNCPDETPDVVETPEVTETPVVGEKGDVEVAKLYCFNPDLAGGVEFEVFDPEFPVEETGITAQAGVAQPDNCTPGAAEFEIFPSGDNLAEPILVTVGSDGIIVIEDVIPVTGEGEAHLIVEASTGAEAFFTVEAGAVTKIIVLNYVGEGEQPGGETPGETPAGETPAGETPAATTSGGVSATTLPDTGAGTGQGGADYGMELFLVLGGLAAAGVSLRRRAA